MKSTDNIHKLIKKLQVEPGADMDRKVHSRITKALEKWKKTKLANQKPNIWKIIMKRSITKLTAIAAVILIAVLITLYMPSVSIDGVSTAYGMVELPRVLKNASVIHTVGWRSSTYYPISGEEKEFEKHPTESWIDKENKRVKFTQFRWHRARPGQSAHYQKLEKLVDGQYYTEINYSTKSVTYFKITDFWRNLFVHRMYQDHLKFVFMDEEELEEFSNVDQEEIDGNTFYIWEKASDVIRGGGLDREDITRCWISPTSGKIKRYRHWTKWYVHLRADEIEEKEWHQDVEREIDIDPILSEDVFTMELPEDYNLTNSKENAAPYELNEWFFPGMVLDGSLIGRVALTAALPNGIVIIGWSLEDAASQYLTTEEPFENLISGQSSPKLPVEILYGLAPESKQRNQRVIFNDTSVSYTGRHLAYSQKNGKFIEWAIYIPNKEVRTREVLPKCEIILGMDPENRKWRHRPRNNTERLKLSYLFIQNENDFDTFIRGAMAELSNAGAALEDITYEGVLELADEIRALMDE